MTTVPKDPMQPAHAHQPPAVSSSSPQTGKGQVNVGPPAITGQPYPAQQITGLGPGSEASLPPVGKPFTSD